MENKHRMKTRQCIWITILLSNAGALVGQNYTFTLRCQEKAWSFPTKCQTQNDSHIHEKKIWQSQNNFYQWDACEFTEKFKQAHTYIDNSYALEDVRKVTHNRSDTKPVWSNNMNHDMQSITSAAWLGS